MSYIIIKIKRQVWQMFDKQNDKNESYMNIKWNEKKKIRRKYKIMLKYFLGSDLRALNEGNYRMRGHSVRVWMYVCICNPLMCIIS